MRIQYVLQEIGHGLRRNLTMVIAVIVSTAVALTMLGAGLLMWQQTKAMEGYWYGKVEVAVYMCNQNDVGNATNCTSAVNPAEQQAIYAKLTGTMFVQHVYYESQAQAFQNYENEYGKTELGQNATQNFLESDYRVKLTDPSKYQVVEGAVGNMAGVASVVDEQQLLQPLFTFTDHAHGQYVRPGAIHSNTAESYFAILKRGVYGTFHHVSEAHMQRYLHEFDFRYSNRSALGVTDAMRSDELLRGIGGKRLTYRRTGQAEVA